MGKNTKGQAAIEFLVTYGWAILAALIVISALTYFGITSPSLPDKCIFSNAFECNDYIVQESAVSVRLINSFGQTIYGPLPDNITAVMTDDSGAPCVVVSNGVTNPDMVEPEAMLEISCIPTESFDQGEKVRIKMSVNYAKNPSGYNQVSLGELYTTVQSD